MNVLHHKETWIMSFEDYMDTEWVVDWAEPSAKHAATDVVTFHGTADKVEIQCKRYMDGRYENGTISGGTGDDKYTITLEVSPGKPRKVIFTPAVKGRGGIGGSWTANDTPPGPEKP